MTNPKAYLNSRPVEVRRKPGELEALLRSNMGPDFRPIVPWEKFAPLHDLSPRTCRSKASLLRSKWRRANPGVAPVPLGTLPTTAPATSRTGVLGPEDIKLILSQVVRTGDPKEQTTAAGKLYDILIGAEASIGPPAPTRVEDQIDRAARVLAACPPDVVEEVLRRAEAIRQDPVRAGSGAQAPQGPADAGPQHPHH